MTDEHHARVFGRKPGTTWRRRLAFGLVVLGVLVLIPWVSYGGSGSIGFEHCGRRTDVSLLLPIKVSGPMPVKLINVIPRDVNNLTVVGFWVVDPPEYRMMDLTYTDLNKFEHQMKTDSIEWLQPGQEGTVAIAVEQPLALKTGSYAGVDLIFMSPAGLPFWAPTGTGGVTVTNSCAPQVGGSSVKSSNPYDTQR